MIADSYQPTAANHNQENIGLEPVWPYGVIGDNTVVNGDNLTALVDRTYTSRQYPNQPDWTYDSIDAARLDMSSQVRLGPGGQHREVPGLHLRAGRRGTPVGTTSRTSSKPLMSR